MANQHTTGWRLPQATNSTTTVGWPPSDSTPVRVLTEEEHDRLLAIEQAAMAVPWPLLRYAGAEHFQCLHCRESGVGKHGISHTGWCAGVRLRDALAALEGGGREGGRGE